MVQFSHLCMITGKTIALMIRTFVSKVMSLLFNMLSRFVIAFLPKSKHLLISWLKSPSTMILEPKEIKFVTISNFSLIFVVKWSDHMPWLIASLTYASPLCHDCGPWRLWSTKGLFPIVCQKERKKAHSNPSPLRSRGCDLKTIRNS